MVPDVVGTLRDLDAILAKLKELQEWDKLAQEEAKPGIPPSFQPSNHTTEDLRSYYAAFAGRSMSLQEALSDPALPASPKEKQLWCKQLGELQRQARLITASKAL